MAEQYDVSIDGVAGPLLEHAVVNVLFDEHRVWSFDAARDSRPAREGQRIVPWPVVLLPRLTGTTRVRLNANADGNTFFDRQVGFDGSAEPLRLVDQSGHPLAVDKSGRLQRSFDITDRSTKQMMAERAAVLIEELQTICGLDAHIGYGSLLGAVRTGEMIGHDSDVDVTYYSHQTNPYDVIRECRRASRTITARGWRTVRMSSANFKVWVPSDSGRIGLDVFASFHLGDHFHVMGSLRGVLPKAAIVPFGEVTLEGVRLPAPADPDRYLAYLYGDDWRIPNPAFKFGVPQEDKAMMTALFRPSRRRLRYWSDFYDSPRVNQVPAEPSLFARWVTAHIEPGEKVLDLGCGTGRDAVWYAQQGHKTRGYDLTRSARRQTRAAAGARGVSVKTRSLNFEDTRSVLLTGAELARTKRPSHLTARGVVDAISADGRASLWRFASMVQRRGGLTFLEFRTHNSRQEPTHFPSHVRAYVKPDVIVREVEAAGGRVLEREVGRDLAPLGEENPEICRLVTEWKR